MKYEIHLNNIISYLTIRIVYRFGWDECRSGRCRQAHEGAGCYDAECEAEAEECADNEECVLLTNCVGECEERAAVDECIEECMNLYGDGENDMDSLQECSDNNCGGCPDIWVSKSRCSPTASHFSGSIQGCPLVSNSPQGFALFPLLTTLDHKIHMFHRHSWLNILHKFFRRQ